MAQPTQPPADTDPKAPERIPPLTNIAPAIFVPLRDDILNLEPPRDRVERLKRILETIDYQREGVKENLMYMFEREKKRMMQEAAETEQARGPPKIRPGLPPSEVDEIIGNMETPAEPDRDYNLQEYPPVAGPPNLSLRDSTVRDLLTMVDKAVIELEGFEGFMAGIENFYREVLARETARIDEAGKRPEERSGFRGF
jgi:hypothetical protein